MSFFNAMNVSASGLTSQRLRMDVISSNIANVETTRTGDGGPYRRQTVVLQEQGISPFTAIFENIILNKTATKGDGVRVAEIVEDQTEGRRIYEPSHPDADEEGYVTMPNVNIVTEMVNMIAASRSYEANITAINLTKTMLAKTMEIGR